MQVEILAAPDPACDEFVRGRPDGRLCFLPGWSAMVEREFGHESFYLVARDGGAVRGVLPLIHVRTLLFGSHMVSQAFVDYGGPLAETDAARDALFARAVELAGREGCQDIEFRNIQPMPYDLVCRTDKASMWFPLAGDPEALWRGFDAKVRNQVRKAEKSGLAAAGGGAELVEEFYRVYTARMRQLGTPCYSRRLMQGILETFPESSRIFVVRREGMTIGGGITTFLGRFAEMLYASTLIEYNSLCPNNLLYWEAIRHYCGAGARWFDFGRSTVGGGTHQFKKQWGAQQVQLNYQYWVRPGTELSVASPDSPKYQWKVRMWKRLPPAVADWLGPRISRGLP